MVAREVKRRGGVPGSLTDQHAVAVGGSREARSKTCAKAARRFQKGMLRVSKRALKPLGVQDAFGLPEATIWLGLGDHISQVLLITACDWNSESLDTPEYQRCWRLGQNSDQTWNLGNTLPTIRRAAAAARESV